jgi:hypothetical protein
VSIWRSEREADHFHRVPTSRMCSAIFPCFEAGCLVMTTFAFLLLGLLLQLLLEVNAKVVPVID